MSDVPRRPRGAWVALVERVTADLPVDRDERPAATEAVFGELVTRYREPHRRYHTLDHVLEVLTWVDRLAESAADPDAVRLAVWAHDVVYDPRAPAGANERASAGWARTSLARIGLADGMVGEVARLVEVTADHRPSQGDADGCVLSDADLAVLGAPAERYHRYVADVRAEYAWVAEDRWREGRAAVLEGFLARESIFATGPARDRLERRARENVAGELRRLAAAVRPAEPGGP